MIYYLIIKKQYYRYISIFAVNIANTFYVKKLRRH